MMGTGQGWTHTPRLAPSEAMACRAPLPPSACLRDAFVDHRALGRLSRARVRCLGVFRFSGGQNSGVPWSQSFILGAMESSQVRN